MKTAEIGLTRRQQQMLDVIREHIRDHGTPPTVREIGDAMEIASPNGVMCHLKALERKGAIKRAAHSSRGIVLLGGKCAYCGK